MTTICLGVETLPQVVIRAGRNRSALLKTTAGVTGRRRADPERERIVHMAMTITPHDDTEFEATGRRRKITKFALAGVAVLGVGAALTSAAWSDNVWFGGNTAAADFELSGSTHGDPLGVWEANSSEGTTIALPVEAFDEIAPGVPDTYDVYVRNEGDIPIYLNPAVVTVGGDMEGLVTTSATYNRTTLQSDQIARVRVVVTGTDALLEGTDGTILVQVEGTSEAPTP
jgi:hypothetical protein